MRPIPTFRVFERGSVYHEVVKERFPPFGLATACGVPVFKRDTWPGEVSEVTCPDCLLIRRVRLEHVGEEVES